MILFSEPKICSLACFDPLNVFFRNKVYKLRGDQTNISAKIKSLTACSEWHSQCIVIPGRPPQEEILRKKIAALPNAQLIKPGGYLWLSPDLLAHRLWNYTLTDGSSHETLCMCVETLAMATHPVLLVIYKPLLLTASCQHRQIRLAFSSNKPPYTAPFCIKNGLGVPFACYEQLWFLHVGNYREGAKIYTCVETRCHLVYTSSLIDELPCE